MSKNNLSPKQFEWFEAYLDDAPQEVLDELAVEIEHEPKLVEMTFIVTEKNKNDATIATSRLAQELHKQLSSGCEKAELENTLAHLMCAVVSLIETSDLDLDEPMADIYAQNFS